MPNPEINIGALGRVVRLLFLTVIPSPYQRELFAALSEKGDMDVSVRYFAAGATDRQWRVPKLACYEKIMPGCTLSRLGASAHFNPTVLSEVREARPDLVVVSDYSAPTAQLAMRWLAWRKQPFVFWGEVPGFSQRGALGSALRRSLQRPLRRASAIAGIGSVATAAYRQLFPGLPVFNVPYFCDLAPFQALSGRTTRRESVNILFSGQMIERKGVDILIMAFREVARHDSRLRLTLIGDGPRLEKFRRIVPKDLENRVIFLGHRDPCELPSIFAEADIFCLPSRHDGWGVVVNEALGAGLPIVVSEAVGAGGDLVVDGENGTVVPVGRVAPLARALMELGDDAKRSRMGAVSRAMSRRWGLDEGVARWQELASIILCGNTGSADPCAAQ